MKNREGFHGDFCGHALIDGDMKPVPVSGQTRVTGRTMKAHAVRVFFGRTAKTLLLRR